MRLKVRMRKVATGTVLVGLALLTAAIIANSTLLASPPPSNQPAPLPQYGVTTVYANESSVGASVITIKITTSGTSPFFVSKLLIFLKPVADGDLILDNINLDGIFALSFTSYGAPKVVVVSAGTTVGDVITSLPPYVNVLLVKEPMGNNALVVNGGGGNGLSVGVRFTSQSYNILVSAEAVVTAPSTDMIMMVMS